MVVVGSSCSCYSSFEFEMFEVFGFHIDSNGVVVVAVVVVDIDGSFEVVVVVGNELESLRNQLMLSNFDFVDIFLELVMVKNGYEPEFEVVGFDIGLIVNE